MKIGFIGMGKLGFPCALAAASRGHDVVGYDVNPGPYDIHLERKYPHREVHAQEMLETTTLRMAITVEALVAHAEIVFIAVQTPHKPEFEGLNRMPDERADFDYEALKNAVAAVAFEADKQEKPTTIVVISTCLPGTCRREVYPLLNEYTGFVYNPFFIAMGTTIDDYLNPEFVLLGYDKAVDKVDSLDRVKKFYREVHSRPIAHRVMSVTSAELCKVFYNVFLGIKIVAANAGMEIAHKVGANIDDVTDALAFATDRVVSTKYMRGGMGDGGGCFIEGELIHTEKGVKAIEEIEIGERVLGSDGHFHEVLETYRRPFKGRVFTIKGRGLTRFTVTGEHPIHVAADLRPLLSNGRRDQKAGPVTGPVHELHADQLTEDFYIVFPTPRDTTEREPWSPPRGKSGPAPREVVLVGDAYVLVGGYYMAEGNIWFDRDRDGAPRRVCFSFNTATDGDYIAELCHALEQVAPGARVSVKRTNPRESCTEVRVDSAMLAKALDHDFGHGYEDKRIPDWILNSDRNSALALRALFRGDGSSHNAGFSFSTISHHLAHGVSLMLRRHGIPSTLQYNPKRVGSDGVTHRAAYDLGINNAVHIPKLAEIIGMPIRHQMQEKEYPNVIFERDGVWYHKVNSIETSEYEGTVYNLNVADVHNYVSVGGLVSNCHPRDQIALSWLAQELGLSYDLCGAMIEAREKQTEWLGELAIEHSREGKLPIIVMGKAYKKGTNLTLGSPAILLKNILDEYPNLQLYQWDPHVDGYPSGAYIDRFFVCGEPHVENGEAVFTPQPAVYIIAADHDEFFKMKFPSGSVVIDPWGKMPDKESVKVIRVGRAS